MYIFTLQFSLSSFLVHILEFYVISIKVVKYACIVFVSDITCITFGFWNLNICNCLQVKIHTYINKFAY